MKSHPGETFSISNVASCIGIEYPQAMTSVNIETDFRKTGIYSFDKHVFTKEDFLPSAVTDKSFYLSESHLLSCDILLINEWISL